jgi:hypothetical protein
VEDLKTAFGRALAFAVEIGYICKDTISFMIRKAGAQERKFNRVISGEPEPIAEVKPEKEDTPKEKVKEEPKADAGAGLASLFG